FAPCFNANKRAIYRLIGSLAPLFAHFPYTTLFRSPSRRWSRRAKGTMSSVEEGYPRETPNYLTPSMTSTESSNTAFRADNPPPQDRKSTSLNSSHGSTSYAGVCLEKHKKTRRTN